jgi:hypothetical protein
VNQDLFSKRRFDLTWASDSSSGEVKSSSLLAYRISIIRQVSGSKVSMTGKVVDSGFGVPLLGLCVLGFSFALSLCQRLLGGFLLGVAMNAP